jgi:excisionase family DNA binding protein
MATPTAQSVPATALIDVERIADLLHCSTRHVQRLAADGRMPAPIRIGSLRRWPRATIEKWIEEGCPSVPARDEAIHAS